MGALQDFYLTYQSTLGFIGLNALLALSVYTTLSAGQLALSNAGFMAIGAYTATLLTKVVRSNGGRRTMRIAMLAPPWIPVPAPGYGGIDYGPRGSSWFVLSGVRGSSIYYQKVLFACGGRIINAFALTYPSAGKREYDSIVTTIEKGFRSTSGPACDTAGRLTRD